MADPHVSKVLSWRDPDGFVVTVGGRILRAVLKEKAEQIRSLLSAPWLSGLVAEGLVPRTVELANPPPVMEGMDRWMWLEHDVLPFPCYPHEVSALQLHDAGQLTLRIAVLAAQNGWTLKDASAWNILHGSGRPVFVDVLSFERRTVANAWVAYGQFVRHFLLPLMVYRNLGITPTEIFTLNRDGITPERAFELIRGTSLLSATALEFVVLPKWLASAGGRKIAAETARPAASAAGSLRVDLMLQTLRRLQRKLTKLRPNQASVKSVWKEYEEDRSHYSDADITAKRGFVREHLQDAVSVLDLGCNAGEFSLLAAECGKAVLATDFDHAALSRLYERIRGTDSTVTPCCSTSRARHLPWDGKTVRWLVSSRGRQVGLTASWCWG